jgi:hypothetical protein
VPKRIELPSADQLFGPTPAAGNSRVARPRRASAPTAIGTGRSTAKKGTAGKGAAQKGAARNAAIRPGRHAVVVTDALAQIHLAETRLVDLSVEDLVGLRDRLEDLLAAPDVSRRDLDRLLRTLP